MSYTTNTYKLHYSETLTGLKFAIFTDLKIKDLKDQIREIYSKIYVEYVIKNPIAKLEIDDMISNSNVPFSKDRCYYIVNNTLFTSKLHEYVSGLSYFD